MDNLSTSYLLIITSVYGIFEMSLIFFFLYKILGLKPNIGRLSIVIMFCVVYIPVTFAAIFMSQASWRPFLGLALVFVSSVVLFAGKTYAKLIYTFTIMIVSSFSDIMVSVFSAVAYQNIFGQDIPYMVQYMSVLFFSAPLKLALLLMMLHVDKKGKLYLPRKYWLAAVISFSIILLGQFAFIQIEFTSFEFGVTLLAYNFVLMVLWITLYFALFFVSRYHVKLNEANLITMQNEMMKKYMLQKQESEQMIKLLSHDLRHNLCRFKQLADQTGDEQAVEAMDEYERILEQYRIPDVGNDVANAIIHEKGMIAQRDSISFTLKGSFDEGLLIAQIDFCSLLGNLLDNALEAAAQVKDAENRFVKLQINRKNHMLLLSLENSYAHEPEMKNGVFITHKENRVVHGLGTVSINNIVEKYNGVIKNTYQDNMFSSNVMLRCYD